jgi:hypothetical protein
MEALRCDAISRVPPLLSPLSASTHAFEISLSSFRFFRLFLSPQGDFQDLVGYEEDCTPETLPEVGGQPLPTP